MLADASPLQNREAGARRQRGLRARPGVAGQAAHVASRPSTATAPRRPRRDSPRSARWGLLGLLLAALALRRRPRAARRPARRGQDAARERDSPRRSASSSAACSSRPTCCPPTSPARRASRRRADASVRGARSSPTCCSPTRSTARRPRRRRRCWRRCRRTRSRSTATHPLPDPFLVVATQNPVEYEGTYPLPEAQRDRFLVRVEMGYPARRRSGRCSGSAAAGLAPATLGDVRPVAGADELRAARAVDATPVAGEVLDYVAPRAPHARAAERRAGREPARGRPPARRRQGPRALAGRDFVTPDDVGAWRSRCCATNFPPPSPPPPPLARASLVTVLTAACRWRGSNPDRAVRIARSVPAGRPRPGPELERPRNGDGLDAGSFGPAARSQSCCAVGTRSQGPRA